MPGRRLDTDAELTGLLRSARRIAVVGLSPRPERASHSVAAYLQGAGYRILPVNPRGGRLLGEPAYPSLSDLPAVCRPDIVDVFRRPDALPDLVADAIQAGCAMLWFQLGVTHPEAEARALAAGIDLVVDRCLLVEHRRLLGDTL
jgi:predicted CoA-binding protein